ncbi:MAG TPA: anhydro-N-acetylmuramic acid kinase [Mycobacteriales bacterium]|nr:anhydro-N-acetylmuramic acid kinase [Mycobacteriales bacterium]
MRVIGVMSGTSHDAIEVAAADLTAAGDALQLRLLGRLSIDFDPALHSAVAAVLPPANTTIEAVCRLDTALGQAFGAAAAQANDQLCAGRAELVCCHGQTVFHWVQDGSVRGTLQLGAPAWIAAAPGLPVVTDLRTADITRGGQGAPLVSIVDRLLLPPADRPRAALNLGGIANITVIAPDGGAVAFDTGPANALIDAAVADHTSGRECMDRDGARAARGRVVPELLAELLSDPYYARPAPKSTGKELFNIDYLRRMIPRGTDIDDVIATLTALTAQTLADACRSHDLSELVVSGGGSHNPVLMDEVERRLGPVRLRPSDELGVPSDAKEALAFAVLGYFTVNGIPATIPECTGAREAAVLGSITPGADPLRLPDPTPFAPQRLQVTG